MITLSKPISSGQAQAYHKEEFANAKENYYTEGERVRGEWQGQLPARWGLGGEVQEQQVPRPAAGPHPEPGGQVGRRQVRARQQQARQWLCRAAVAHARRDLQYDRDSGGPDPRAATAGALQDTAVRDSGVPLGTGGAVAGAWLRNRTRRARAAGDQGLHARIFGDFESSAAANRRPYGKGRSARGWRRANRGASDARCQAAVIA